MNNRKVPGCPDKYVREVKERLMALGYWPHSRRVGERYTVYTQAMKEAVAHFQQTNVDVKGMPLLVDGVAGPMTREALQACAEGHFTGAVLEPKRPPRGIGVERTKILETALSMLGAKEEPMGSNRGPEIDRVLPGWCRRKPGQGPPWCCFFASWAVREGLGKLPWGRTRGSVYQTYLAAKEAKIVKLPTAVQPGDLAVMLYQKRPNGVTPGHIFPVLAVEAGNDHRYLNGVEGNCGNAVRVTTRHTTELAWVIRVAPEPAGTPRTGLVRGSRRKPLKGGGTPDDEANTR